MSQQPDEITTAADGEENRKEPPSKIVEPIVEGEALAHCSDSEWEQSESAYSADLLNVKKKSNRVTVFSAPEKIVDATGQSIRQMPIVREIEETDPRVKGIARLVAGITKTLLDDEQSKGVEVTVTLKLHLGDKANHIK